MLENTDAECSCPYAFEDIKKYFELASKCDSVPSLSEFVRENTDLVVRSHPEVNDFKSLDGVWKKKFTSVAKILNMEESISVFSFSAFMASQSGFALRYKERITVRRREKTFTMYEQEHEIIGSQLFKDQENYLENYEPNNLQDDESTTAKRNEENHNKHVIASDSDDDFQKVAESMVGSVERAPLMIEDIDIEKTFIDYRDQCENIFDLCHSDIMDMRPTSRFTNEIAEEAWTKFVLNTYPEYNLPKNWENFVQEFFKSKDSLKEWKTAWRGLYKSEFNETDQELVDVIHNILGPYIEAFEAPTKISYCNLTLTNSKDQLSLP
ncbi:uncharacterized protein OCT59_018653 [Rhizophagus irregularis]|uniref:uncharacterized protein n=1 Tax=Rhizophagus irregularis TaxID=588596 RepID=UPI003326C16B|nr:hypothetical protein OCT59_018653 [Rhizophagus irregularis]